MIEDNTLNDKINEVARLRNKIAYQHENKEHTSTTENNREDKKDKTKDGLLAPSDIRITYSVSDEIGGSGEYENDLSLNVNNVDDDGSHDLDTDSWTFGIKEESNQNENSQKQPWYTSSYEDNIGEIEPPRALPSRIVNKVQPRFHRNGDLSDRFPHNKVVDTVKETPLRAQLIRGNTNEYLSLIHI